MAIGNLHTSVISLNVNGLNSPIKRHRVADWIKKKKNPNHMLPSEDTPKLQMQRYSQS